MSYYCAGGDIPLGEPDGSRRPPLGGELDEVALRRVYENGPRHFSVTDKHEALQLSGDLLEVLVPGKNFQPRSMLLVSEYTVSIDEVSHATITPGVSVRANAPVPQDADWYYFEIEIVGILSSTG